MDEKELKKQWEDVYSQYQKTGDMNILLQGFSTNPDLAKWAAAQQEAKERGEKGARLATGIELLKNIGFTVASLNQIAQANSAAGQLQRPSIPGAPRRDPLLSEALYRAQRGVVDPAAILAPAKQGIQDAYRENITQAQNLSGGQAGAAQAMTQLANVQRMKASLGLAPIAQQAQLQNQGVYNDLLGQRLAETQNQFQNQFAGAQLGAEQYNLDSQAVGALGQSGRTNLADSLGRVADTISNNPYYLPFNDGIKNYMNKVKQTNTFNTSQVMNPYQNYSGSYEPFTPAPASSGRSPYPTYS